MSKVKLEVKTVGQLRQFLVGIMTGIENGTFDLEAAGKITKLAAQVNESFYSEIKVASLRKELNQEDFKEHGKLSIGE